MYLLYSGDVDELREKFPPDLLVPPPSVASLHLPPPVNLNTKNFMIIKSFD